MNYLRNRSIYVLALTFCLLGSGNGLNAYSELFPKDGVFASQDSYEQKLKQFFVDQHWPENSFMSAILIPAYGYPPETAIYVVRVEGRNQIHVITPVSYIYKYDYREALRQGIIESWDSVGSNAKRRYDMKLEPEDFMDLEVNHRVKEIPESMSSSLYMVWLDSMLHATYDQERNRGFNEQPMGYFTVFKDREWLSGETRGPWFGHPAGRFFNLVWLMCDYCDDKASLEDLEESIQAYWELRRMETPTCKHFLSQGGREQISRVSDRRVGLKRNPKRVRVIRPNRPTSSRTVCQLV